VCKKTHVLRRDLQGLGYDARSDSNPGLDQTTPNFQLSKLTPPSPFILSFNTLLMFI
jgi:hypothetical protein